MSLNNFNNFGSSNGYRMMSDINVTPMVDVMLVLLIIFMVAAPMMTQGLEVDLPKVDSQALRTENEITVLTIKADGELVLDNTPVATGVGSLDFQVKAAMKTAGTETVFIKADKNVAYGHVAKVMGNLRKAGITNVGLVTEAPEAGDTEDNITPHKPFEGEDTKEGVADKGTLNLNEDTVESSNLE